MANCHSTPSKYSNTRSDACYQRSSSLKEKTNSSKARRQLSTCNLAITKKLRIKTLISARSQVSRQATFCYFTSIFNYSIRCMNISIIQILLSTTNTSNVKMPRADNKKKINKRHFYQDLKSLQSLLKNNHKIAICPFLL